MQVRFDDPSDKYVFWQGVAREAQADPTFGGLISISEIWHRSLEGHPVKPISELAIVGEGLQVVGADRTGAVFVQSFEVEETPQGKRISAQKSASCPLGVPNFLFPVVVAWKARPPT